MVVYWSFLLLSLIMIVVSNVHYRKVEAYGEIEKRAHLLDVIIFFGIIIFFIGLRSGVADTSTYIWTFNGLPSNILNLDINELSRDKGFYILSVIFKQFVSSDFHLWLLLIAIISGISVMKTLYKYSSNFGISVYLFIATTQFTWMLNGMRQFIAVSCLFGVLNWVIERKTWKFIILVLFLSTIHGTAFIMIPVYFIVQQKPWSKMTIIPIILIIFVGIGMERFPSVFSGLLENTQYSGYMSNIGEDSGSSIIRAIIAAIPITIAFINKNLIKRANNQLINISINMVILNFAFMVISTFTSGIYMGRIGIYFELYNLLLLPWLINTCFKKEIKLLMYGALLVLYAYYFKYQMVDIWNIYYISDILGIFVR